MKRFIIISLMATATLTGWACAWPATHNHYLFSPYDSREFGERVSAECNNNWKTYLGIQKDYYYFDADEVVSAARRKQDLLMVSYAQNLKKYLDCAEQKRNEKWDYPTKEQLARRQQTLQSVRVYAQGKLKSRLRSQHALLFMRCNMMLGRHQENVTFYRLTGSKMIESVYRDMMQNIYAGALLHTGNEVEAARLFAQQGDYESLMTQYYKRRSCAAIRQEYQRDPNSPVLPFLLKDFVNNTQEAADAKTDPEGVGGKLFIRKIQQKEAAEMCHLCRQVVKEGRTATPALWQSAMAWIEYLVGDRRQAVADIASAMNMAGTSRMKDNARALSIYINAAQSKPDRKFDDYIAAELQWLDVKRAEDDHYGRVLDRLVHQVLVSTYSRRPVTAVAILRATGCDLYASYIDTLQVERLQQYIDYAGGHSNLALDRYLQPRQHLNRTVLYDLVGTKYMRLCQWQQAVNWLQRVPASYYTGKGYAVYAANRRWNVEPWLKRQWLKEGMEYADRKWQFSANPKLEFAREMQSMEARARVLSATASLPLSYDLAVHYAQAHYTGDCWFLMRDGKSIDDTVRVHETDLGAKAVALLREVSRSTDFQMKEKALFALSYLGLHQTAWFEYDWSSISDNSPRRKPLYGSSQYKAFSALASFEKQHATRTSQYVSRCDEYRQFLKQYGR